MICVDALNSLIYLLKSLEKLTYHCFVTFANSPWNFGFSWKMNCYLGGSLKFLKSLASSQFREAMAGTML